MRRKWAGIACIVMLATGCAGPQLATSPVTASEEAEANRAMQSEALPPELRTSGVEQVEMVRRVERRIRPATQKVCARTLDRETCRGQYRKISVHVKPEDDTINATADIQGNVTFYGGLVHRVGSDDEIAGVMGHEMAHVLLKHNEKAQQNTAVGMAIGGLITGVMAASAGPCYTVQCTNARTDLQAGGSGRGTRALQPGAGGGSTRQVHRTGGRLQPAGGAQALHPHDPHSARGAAGCWSGREGPRRLPEDTPDGRAADRPLERDQPAQRGQPAAPGEHRERGGTRASGTPCGQMRAVLPGVTPSARIGAKQSSQGSRGWGE